jgi:hypothetical protein
MGPVLGCATALVVPVPAPDDKAKLIPRFSLLR